MPDAIKAPLMDALIQTSSQGLLSQVVRHEYPVLSNASIHVQQLEGPIVPMSQCNRTETLIRGG